jgi:hypothetical protein
VTQNSLKVMEDSRPRLSRHRMESLCHYYKTVIATLFGQTRPGSSLKKRL